MTARVYSPLTDHNFMTPELQKLFTQGFKICEIMLNAFTRSFKEEY